jgi:hypothetical protein
VLSQGGEDQSPEPFAAAFRAAFKGSDLHMRVRAAALRAARTLAIEDRVAEKLPRD